MCTVQQVVYVRQQTVQHTPVKLKTLIFNSKSLCGCLCGDWEGWHEIGQLQLVLMVWAGMLSHVYTQHCNLGIITVKVTHNPADSITELQSYRNYFNHVCL